jgi:fumarate reductase flavoprotein subunit
MNNDKTNEVINGQIVIIGGGGAGLSAAVAAAEKGAEVIVLEKQPRVGGNSALAEGLFAAESKPQKRFNINAPRDELLKMALDYSHYSLDGKILRAFIDKSGDTIQWLEDKGLSISGLPSYYPNQRIPTWHYINGRGIVLLNILSDECKKFGVKILVGTRARQLIVNQKQEITGVLVSQKNKSIQINASCVIVATGGYGGNTRMLSKYIPFYTKDMIYRGIPNKGDGILMSLKAGAASEGLGILQLSGMVSPKLNEFLNAIVEQPDSIWINKKGERFIDETAGFNHFESINSLIRQPERLGYALFDKVMIQNYIRDGIAKGLGQIIPPGSKIINLQKELDSAIAGNGEWITASDSWDDIASWAGMKPEHLKLTIEEYNTSCKLGYDHIFAKDKRYLLPPKHPPYYAIKCYPSFLSTIGGIKINHRMQVLDKNADPITGLFAAGSDTGGWEPETYNANLSGSAFGFAINSGRIAGENAASFVLKTR